MAKLSYKIPASLDASYGDIEIALQSSDGLGVKPLPIKIILAYLASAVMCMWVCTKTLVQYGSVVQIGLFVVIWLLLTLLLVKYDGTKRMQLEMVPTLLSYLPKGARRVIVRSSSHSGDFYGIVGREAINKKTGLVEFADGTFGYFYAIVGSASILLFEDDKNAILSRVDSFYRKFSSDVELLFITTKSGQSVYRQLFSLKTTYENLSFRDPDLKELANEQFKVLRDYVGKEFKSVHQYLVLKGDNREVLNQAKNALQSEVENSSLMIKKCTPLNYTDMVALSRIIYQGQVR